MKDLSVGEKVTKSDTEVTDLAGAVCALRPLACRVEDHGGSATFDYNHLKRFSEQNPTGSFVVKNERSEVVGIMHATFIRDWFLEQAEDRSSRALPDFPHRQSQPSPCA